MVVVLLISVLVENVCVAWLRVKYGSAKEGEAGLSKKTRAKPGAGTGITHVEALQLMLTTLRVPLKRPLTVKSLPRVYKSC